MSKVKNSLIANGEDLVNEYVVMSMNNLLEYSDNYSRTLRNLRNCYIGEIDNVDNDALGVKVEDKNNTKNTSTNTMTRTGTTKSRWNSNTTFPTTTNTTFKHRSHYTPQIS